MYNELSGLRIVNDYLNLHECATSFVRLIIADDVAGVAGEPLKIPGVDYFGS